MNKYDDNYIDTLDSLQESIIAVGGRFFSKRQLMDMPLDELLGIMAPNGIRFTVIKKIGENCER